MKEFVPAEHLVVSETYHGTKMDQKALTFHTQLYEWNEAQSLVNKHTQALAANRTGSSDVFMPMKKLAQIEYWTRQVNRYYRPSDKSRPKSGSFMKIDVRKYNMKVEKDAGTRSKSAIYPRGGRATSAVSRATTSTLPVRRRFFGNDINTVKNHLFESQMFYSAQRKDIRSASTRKSQKSAKTESATKYDRTEVSSEQLENGADGTESDTVTIIDHGDDGSDLESTNKLIQPQIVSRSYSNRELNVISIDDCKLTCRYRPQMIKESRKLDDEDSDSQNTSTAKEKVKRKSGSKQREVSHKTEEMNGNEADDEISTDTVETLDNNMERMDINGVDTNNNSPENVFHEKTNRRDTHTDSDHDSSSDSMGEMYQALNKISSKAKQPPTAKSEDSDCSKSKSTDTGNDGYRANFSSRGSSRSYGRVTNLSSPEATSKPDRRPTKVSRPARISSAINNVVDNRRVMNSMEKDFDTRTAEYGRTVIETSEGSQKFKKRHARLREMMDLYMDTHSAIDMKGYHEKLRRNSAISSDKTLANN